jgi:thymidylate kinase
VRITHGLDRKSTSTLSFGLTASLDLASKGCDAALVLNVANGFYLPLLDRAGVPTCVNVDGLEWLRGKWGWPARQVFLRGAVATARYADALIFDSRAVAEVWLARFGRDGYFIPYGAPVLRSVGSSRLRSLELPTHGYVLVVARLVPENNAELLLDAVEALPSPPPVVVVGDSNYEHPTVQRTRRLAQAKKVHWLGHVDDEMLLDELWANAGVYWHGHSVGGTNPALLQALGAGAPTIALDTPFNREVIGRPDQLVPQDAGLLSDRIARVLQSSSLAEDYRDWGRRTVAERYSWDAVCSEYERVLERLASMRASGTAGRAARIVATSRGDKSVGRDDVTAGRVIAIVGPDGAGKSTLTATLQEVMRSRHDLDVAVVNFRGRYADRMLRRDEQRRSHSQALGADPRSTPRRGPASASAKALFLWLDVACSAFVWRRRRRQITLVERYIYDFIVDPERLGLARAPRRLREGAVRLSLRPDVVVLCRAPAATLRSRKQELPLAEIERQYRVWKDLRILRGTSIIEVDTSGEVDVTEIANSVLERALG